MICQFIRIFVFTLLIILSFSCDLQKFSGSDYSYSPPPESAIFTGTIFNKFTLEPVALSEINIANQGTYSDESGQYILYYHYGEDDERNQPINVKISAENYQNVDTSIIIFPENKLDAFLPYAAPIIKKIALVIAFPKNKLNVFLPYAAPNIKKIALVDSAIIQAIVFDYQGFNDIVSVHAQYAYTMPGQRTPSLYAESKLTRVFVDSINTSYYETRVSPYIEEYGWITPKPYSARAEDRKKYQDYMTSLQGGTDTLLFPISTK